MIFFLSGGRWSQLPVKEQVQLVATRRKRRVEIKCRAEGVHGASFVLVSLFFGCRVFSKVPSPLLQYVRVPFKTTSRAMTTWRHSLRPRLFLERLLAFRPYRRHFKPIGVQFIGSTPRYRRVGLFGRYKKKWTKNLRACSFGRVIFRTFSTRRGGTNCATYQSK